MDDRSVLIVDDSAVVREQLSQLYSSLGFHVAAQVTNGVEAVAFLQENTVSLISLDIIMPVMDGIEAYRIIRKQWPATKCLFVTVLATEPRLLEAYKNEIDRRLFVSKALGREELLEAIEVAFGDEGSKVESASFETGEPLKFVNPE
jgi:CheY-like chemotaxis protein